MADPVSVRGGSGGVEAHYDDMTAAARLFGRAAGDTGGAVLALHGYLIHPDVLACAAFDPAGAAEFEARILAALDGPSGITWLAARCATVDVALRTAAAAYLGADRLDERLEPELGAVLHAPKAVCDGVARLGSGDVGAALQRVLADDPEAADLGVDVVANLLAGGSVADGARLLGLPFDDGTPHVIALGTDPGADAPGAPRCFADLVAGLARRDKGRPGEVDVRILDAVDPAGHPVRKVIVDIPGTKDWSLSRHDTDVTSIATNLRALAGEVTSYERGVIEAMRRAGVRLDDDVLMIGHSEGGMVAVNAARHLAASGEFHVRHVVTAGAPIGRIAGRVPAAVNVLALENDGDVVPHLDGAENPDRVNVVTVTTHHEHRTLIANHDLAASYVPAARDLDASDEQSVRDFLGGIDGFLTADEVHTHTFQITRSY